MKKLQEFKPNQEDIMAYLEDAIEMDNASQEEKEVFEDIKWFGYASEDSLLKVIENIKQAYNEK